MRPYSKSLAGFSRQYSACGSVDTRENTAPEDVPDLEARVTVRGRPVQEIGATLEKSGDACRRSKPGKYAKSEPTVQADSASQIVVVIWRRKMEDQRYQGGPFGDDLG